MIKYMTRLEKNVPTPTSSLRSLISLLVAPSPLDAHPSSHCLLFFNLLRRLPEEKIGTDGRTKYGDQRRPCLMTFRPTWNEGVVHDCGPVGPKDDRGNDVRKQSRGEPFQNIGNLIVTEPNSREGDDDAERADKIMRAKSGEHLGGIGHAEEIGADVDCIRD